MENGRTGTNAGCDIKVASSKKADSGSENASSGKNAISSNVFAKALSLLLSIALLLSLAACVGTEGGQSGSGDDAEQPIDGDTPPEGDADPIEDGTAPTGDGDTSTDDATEGENEGEDGANGEDGSNENETHDNATEPDNPTSGDTQPDNENPEDTQSVYPAGTFRIDENGERVFVLNGKEVDEREFLRSKIHNLDIYNKEFSYTDESGEKSIEEIAEILFTMFFDSAREYNDELGFVIVEGNIAEIRIITEKDISLEVEQGADKEINSLSNLYPDISENCWGAGGWIGVHAFAGQLQPLTTGSLDVIHTSEDYEDGMFYFEGTDSGPRYITRDPVTNTYSLSGSLPIPW